MLWLCLSLCLCLSPCSCPSLCLSLSLPLQNAAAHAVKASEPSVGAATASSATSTESHGVLASIRRAWQAAHASAPPTLKFGEEQGGAHRVVAGTVDALIEFGSAAPSPILVLRLP